MFQATLKAEASVSGIGAHSGSVSAITLQPAPEGSGIVYVRRGLNAATIGADYRNVCAVPMCTRLVAGEHSNVGVSVVEHLSAAFYALGICNAVVHVDGEEIPILDGSAIEFMEKISGIRRQSKLRKKLKILKSVRLEDETRWAELSPLESNEFIININCDFSAKGLRTEPFLYKFSCDSFLRDIAPARTFGFLSDKEYYAQHNIGLGASTENTVVFDDGGHPITDLRFPNEPIRHKILDAIGDLSLAGCEIVGRYDAFCPGHKINNLILRKLFSDPKNFQIIE